MVAVNHLKKARGEIWPKRSERRNNTKTQDEDKKSAINKKNNSQIKKPHLKMIPIKDSSIIIILFLITFFFIFNDLFAHLCRVSNIPIKY